MNCRSISGKTALFDTIIDQEEPDIILGTESWLNYSVNSSEIFPPEYTIFRKDRENDARRGGVFIAVKEGISVIERNDQQLMEAKYYGANCHYQKGRTSTLAFITDQQIHTIQRH